MKMTIVQSVKKALLMNETLTIKGYLLDKQTLNLINEFANISNEHKEWINSRGSISIETTVNLLWKQVKGVK